jgi:hypothetical protein
MILTSLFDSFMVNDHSISSDLQQLNHSLFLLEIQLLRELDVELHDEIPSLSRLAFDGHSVALDNSCRLRRNYLVEMKIDQLPVEFSLSNTRITTVMDLESNASINLIFAV